MATNPFAAYNTGPFGRKPTKADQATMLMTALAAATGGKPTSMPGVGGPDHGRPTAAHLGMAAGQLPQVTVKAPWDAKRAAEIDAKYGPGASERRAARLALHISLARHPSRGTIPGVGGTLGGQLPQGDYAGQVARARKAGLLPGQAQRRPRQLGSSALLQALLRG